MFLLPIVAGAAAITFLSMSKAKRTDSWVEDRAGVLWVKSAYVQDSLAALSGLYAVNPTREGNSVRVQLAREPGAPPMGARAWSDTLYATGYTTLVSLYSQELAGAPLQDALALANISAAKLRYEQSRQLSGWAIVRTSPNPLVTIPAGTTVGESYEIGDATGSMLGYRTWSASIGRLSYMMPPAARAQWLNVRRGQPCRLVNEGTVWVYRFGEGPVTGWQVIDPLRENRGYVLLANGSSLAILPAAQPGESAPRMGWYGPKTQKLLESMTNGGWLVLSDPPR